MGDMRLLIEVRDEDVTPLRTLALRDHRTVREQAGFLVALKIHEELARLQGLPPVEPVAETA